MYALIVIDCELDFRLFSVYMHISFAMLLPC